MRLSALYTLCLLAFTVSMLDAQAATVADWSRFRGPNGSGISTDTAPLPVTFGEKENLKWKFKLRGPGSSCPIVVGNDVFVTCWSGYGIDQRNPGNMSDLKRHLICIDRRNGKEKWSRAVDAVLPEDEFGGMFAQHGYATHTPVSDGERVYVFFGVSGVVAFDLEGKQLWKKSVGTDLDPRRWGSSSSPILYKKLLIVPALVESQSMVAFDKLTGEVKWSKKAGGFGSTWGTPTLVDVAGGRQELVIAVPEEIWGFNPDTGRFNWYCKGLTSDSVCTSVVAADGIVYAIGGRRQSNSVAVRAGGKNDVEKSNMLWSGRAQSGIATPIFHDGRLYWISGGIANCADAKTGESLARVRLGSGAAAPRNDDAGNSGGRRRFGGRGGFGGQDYSSPVAGDGKIFFVKRGGEVHVFKLDEKLEKLATNQIGSDGEDFSASPAISNGELFIRSSRTLYCFALGK
jgi:outer membrane protein assembly factor BamB